MQRVSTVMPETENLILGGGMVAGFAAKAMVEAGLESGRLTILSADGSPPYHRPPLSKGFLAGEEEAGAILINDPGFYDEHGIELRLETRAEAVDLAARTVRTAGGEELSFGRLLIATGAEPRRLDVPGAGLDVTGLFRGSPLELDDGVVVDERLATGVPGVWAAGDVARYRDVALGGRRRVEHWDTAVHQGGVAGRNLLGAQEVYDRVPYFFSDVFDLSWELWGSPEGADEVAVRGRIESGSFSVWWLRDSRVAAAFVMDRPDGERDAAEGLIRSGTGVVPAALRDEDEPLEAQA